MTKAEIQSLSVDALISRYNVSRADGGKICFSICSRNKNDGQQTVVSVMRERKAEILAYFDAQEKAAKESAEARQRKINAIPGLKELDDAYADLGAWHREFQQSFDGEGGAGVGVRHCPEYDLKDMEQKYPAAVAYRKARELFTKENLELSQIGEIAMNMIENSPDNYQAALDYMASGQKAFVERHLWD